MAGEPTVHIIDDDDAARHSLAFLVESAGYDARAYASAPDFLASLEGGPEPGGCIVTDVRMPEMTGLELLDRLKLLGVTEPVIIITGHADVPMAIQAMKAGVFDFIEKPFSDEAILSVIAKAMNEGAETAAFDREKRDAEQRIASLSQRELEVLDGLVEGKANKAIAYDLGISVRTVEVYRANVMTKLRARSLPEVVRLALNARAP